MAQITRPATRRHEARASGSSRPCPGPSCPVAAKSHVENDLLGFRTVEASVLIEWEVCRPPFAPSLWPRVVGLQIMRDFSLRNVVDRDTACIPNSSEDARVLRIPFSRTLNLSGPAAEQVLEVVGVAVGRARALHAVLVTSEALSELSTIQLTVLTGVKGNLADLVIGILHDIQLTPMWPENVSVHEPESWPHTSTVRHMVVLHGNNEACVWSPSLLGVEHHRCSLEGLRLCSDADVHMVAMGLDDSLPEGILLVQVVDCAVGLVFCEEKPLVKEGAAGCLPGQAV
mmetsp:Transcript_95030/g.168760  ORF Transcript_95030/g.168760 Transcript_95030/m.168760 type:complete len:286 (-) Transcript_95030:674-1531(-)